MRLGIVSNSDYSIPLLGTLASQQMQVFLFYSPSPDLFTNQKMAAFAHQSRIQLTEEKNRNRDIYSWINDGQFDVCFIIGYSYLLQLNQIKAKTQILNIHFGPLPAFGGPSPLFWQLREGNTKVGLAIHRVNEKFDDGEILWIKELENHSFYDTRMLGLLFSQHCVEGAFFILQLLFNNLPLIGVNRKEIKPSYHKRPQLWDVSIKWQDMSAEKIAHLVKACNPWNKGAISFMNGKEIKLMDARVKDEKTDQKAGTIIQIETTMQIACCDERIIEVSMVYFNDSFIAAYHLKKIGFKLGQYFE